MRQQLIIATGVTTLGIIVGVTEFYRHRRQMRRYRRKSNEHKILKADASSALFFWTCLGSLTGISAACLSSLASN